MNFPLSPTRIAEIQRGISELTAEERAQLAQFNRERYEKKSAAGKKGGEARWSKQKKEKRAPEALTPR